MPEMRRVFSSHVEEIGYDAEKQELHVKYRDGRTSVHDGVSQATADRVLSAPSIGTALHQHVRGKHGHRYA